MKSIETSISDELIRKLHLVPPLRSERYACILYGLQT